LGIEAGRFPPQPQHNASNIAAHNPGSVIGRNLRPRLSRLVAKAIIAASHVNASSISLTPVNVGIDVPADVLPVVVTVNVELPVPVTVTGEKLAVVPPGKPLAFSVTTPAKPFSAPIFVVYVVALPFTTVCAEGVPAIVKSGGGGCAFTTRLTIAVCVRLPLTPWIERVDVPTDVLDVVVTVSVELPVPVTAAGEKLAVVPPGNPLAPSVTTPPNPFSAPIVVVYVAALP